jgi:hypothetical protein
MFLILLNELRNQEDKTELWFSPQRADTRYGLSEDTRSKGLRGLAQAGLAATGWSAFSDHDEWWRPITGQPVAAEPAFTRN